MKIHKIRCTTQLANLKIKILFGHYVLCIYSLDINYFSCYVINVLYII